MHTSRFSEGPGYSNGATARFLEATNDMGEMVALAVRLVRRIWRDGFCYAKAGVMITELLPTAARQPAVWSEVNREKREMLWKVVDGLNGNLGRGAVRILSEGPNAAAWKLRAEHRTPRWTTRWEELRRVRSR